MPDPTQRLIKELRIELGRQWGQAHHEMCGAWPHTEDDDCYWERPTVLDAAAAALAAAELASAPADPAGFGGELLPL